VWWAGFAALLLSLDGLHIVQSRMAMLDVFLSTFILAGVLFLVLDRERMDGLPGADRWPRMTAIFGSPYRFWAGIFLGAALATKWSGALALLAGTALCAGWVFTGGRRAGRSVTASVGVLVASFAIVPLGVYLLSYGAFFYQHGPDLPGFVALQTRMLQFQRAYVHANDQGSQPWTWPLLLHPIRYYRTGGGGSVHTIVALGNPALWWGFLLCLPVGALTLARRATWKEASIFGMAAALYLPWLAVNRTQFIFYMVPVVPFMCLGVAAVLRSLPRRAAVAGGSGFAVAIVLAAIAFLPVWTGWGVSQSWLDHLRWLPGWPL
jgi:dolichyl-phosphate-mannose--protein O-mannosyl transferase